MIRLREAAPLLIALFYLCASPAFALDAGRFGKVRLVNASGPARGIVILFSDREGFGSDDNNAADVLARTGVVVVEVDTPAYLAHLDRTDEKCHEIVFDAEWVSRGLQREQRFPNYLTPILAGTGEGGTLAELGLSEAPSVTIAGAVEFNPTATLPSRRPICTSASVVAGRSGWVYGAPGPLPGYWSVGFTPRAPEDDQTRIAALERAGVSVELHRFGPSTAAGDALGAMIEPHLTALSGPSGGISALPLKELPVAHPPGVIAVELSGDGGWRDLDKTVADDLQRDGIPVVGLDSLRYFWSEKTPDQTARDLGAIMQAFMDRWGADKVALIGYSFGADVMPFAYNRLPASLRSHVVLIALLGLANSADFQISVLGWLGEPPSPKALPIIPEAERLPVSLVECYYGATEGDTACPKLAKTGVKAIRLAGGHHFDGNYGLVERHILAGLEQRAHLRAPLVGAANSESSSLSETSSEGWTSTQMFFAAIGSIMFVTLLIWVLLGLRPERRPPRP